MVKFVSAKCPNCGGTLKLSKDSEKVICEYCHQEIIVDDAIACYKLKISGKVSVDGITTNSDLIESANELLDMDEYLKAKRKFLEFSEKCPNDYQGWLGLLICRTRNFTIKDNNIMFENDVKNYYTHFKDTASKEVFDQYFETIDRYFNPEKYVIIDSQKLVSEYKERVEKQKKNKREILAKITDNETYKTITDIANKGKKSLSKWGIGLLYFFGGVFVLGGLVNDTPLGEKILTILIGLSLFNFIYDFIGKKLNIQKKYLLIMRIVIPLLLLIVVVSIFPPSSNSNESQNITQQTINDNTDF